ncbi:DNA repair exonuclease [Paenibacillus sp. HB172176]|uniref:metallophosphoesterase family protein n=1 Tax=Paenibacillus sp. HB172176 TaxID=2493690 RepID=UPI00143BD7A3|nr:DNA repair exonuclease [Paenibacillus sp. HB172176]
MGAPFRFIHAADLHLDSPFRGLSRAPEAVRESLVAADFAALRKLTDTAIAEKVDFIVIAGDLFDEADRSLRAQLTLVKEWERLEEHGIAVFAIHGNHDHLGGSRARMALPSNVHIFGSERVSHYPAYCRSGELAAYVYGISYGERAVLRNLAEEYAVSEEAPFHIALYHGNVGGDLQHDPYAACQLEQLTGSAFHYWALGHIHKRQELHAYPHVVYAGNMQGRHPREAGEKGCYLVEVSSSHEVRLVFMPLDSIRFQEESVSIEDIGGEQELLLRLRQLVMRVADESKGRSIMLRIRIGGSGPLHDTLLQSTVISDLLLELQGEFEPQPNQPWVYLYALEAATRAELDWSSLADEDSFAGEMLRLSEQLAVDTEQWRSFSAESLGDIRTHAKLGRLGRAKWDELPERWLQEAKELAIGLVAEGVREKGG